MADPPTFATAGVVIEETGAGGHLVRSTLDLPAYEARVTDHLFLAERRIPDRVFLRERANGAWRQVTYREAASGVRALASALRSLGLGPDRPLAVLSGNSIGHALIGFAAMAVGIPYAPISPQYSLASADLGKLRHILGLLRPGALFVEDVTPFTRALAAPEAQGVPVISGIPAADGCAASLAELLATPPEPGLDAVIAAVDPDAPVKLLFTSGSTGRPKGVLTTHRMMAVNQEQIAAVWPFLTREPPVLLDWLPWNHVFGNSHNLGMALRHGGTLWIDDGRPMPGQFGRTLRNLRDVQPTISFNVPKAYELLIPQLEQDDGLARHVFARLRLMFYAGAALSPPLWRRLEALAARHAPRKVEMVSSWGLTETAPSALMVHRSAAPPGSIGTPMPGMTLKLVPNGDKLEAFVRGPNVTPGYWRDEGATADAFDADGFFRTGDAVCWVDPAHPDHGFRFDGRLTEDFKLSSGTRVNAGEVRLRALAAFTGTARDMLVCGENREEVGLLLIPHDHRRDGLDGELPTALHAEVCACLAALNDGAAGLSRRVGRAAFLAEPLSMDAGEMTDKGSLNLRTILARRAADLHRLYEGGPGVVVAP